MKFCFSVLLLALVNCDNGRSDGDTDDDSQQTDVVAGDKTPETIAKAETITSPNANVTNVSSEGNKQPEVKPKTDEGDLNNGDANKDTNNNDDPQDDSDGSDGGSKPAQKLTEGQLEATPPTNKTEKPKDEKGKPNEEKTDATKTSTKKSETNITPKGETSTTSTTSTTTSTTTKSKTTTTTTSTTSEESEDEGGTIYTDDEDITDDGTKDDTQADKNVPKETTTKKATEKATDLSVLEPVDGLKNGDEAEIEADLKSQNYFMVSALFEFGTLF